ncbi:Ribosomal protein L21-like [Dillenia turbinata]|uniref:Ribosomal protein L21-like n=1 Tax=Dillenia turbinata TaxID=194707 RepID=A0AAN8W4F5_9MAGN
MASTATAISVSATSSPFKLSLSHFPKKNYNSSFLSLSKPSISHSLSSRKSIFTQNLSSKPSFSLIPKFSESEAPVIEPEAAPDPESTEIETGVEVETALTQIVEVEKEVPKREEIFAVVMIGSRQYIVFPGRFIYIQRLKGANVNDKIILNKVLLVGTKNSTYIGKPVVTNAAVHAVVEEQGLNPKVIVFKYKKKKNYRRKIGHRQPNTRIRITSITGYQDYPATTLET